MFAPEIMVKHRIFQIFAGGYVFTTLTPVVEHQLSKSAKGKSNTGSDLWCIVELSGDAVRGISGVYTTSGECGSVGAWLGM